MFKWFKRAEAGPSRVAARADVRRPPAPVRAEADAAPAPLPEVVAEGNSQSDWSAWEDSMTALDSQFQGLDAGARVQVRETRPSQLDELDAFATLGRRRDF